MDRLLLYMPTGGNELGLAKLRVSTRLAAHIGVFQRFLYRNYQSTSAAVRNWLTIGGFVNSERVTDEMVEVFTTCAQQGGAEYAIRNFHAGHLNFDLEARMATLSQPMTLIWGTDGGEPSTDSAHKLQALSPGSNLIMLPNLGVLGALEDPEMISKILLDQLDPGLRVLRA